MKRSKLIFACVAVALILICTMMVILFNGNTEQPGTESLPESTAPIITESPDFETAPLLSTPPETEQIPATEPYAPDHGVSGLHTQYDIPDNVTIRQVKKNPNEVINAYIPISPDDPEYIPSTDENYEALEGKVFRNDKVISIELFDELTGKDMTISFGYITGELNRFLYLNPVVECSESYPQYGFYFNTMPASGGNILTLPADYETEEDLNNAKMDANSFHVGRSLDQNQIATYQDPTHPGTVWFTQMPIQGDLWIDVLVYQMGGDMRATLRLTIAKDADGTYSIVNLEDKNLLQTYDQKDAPFSKNELAHIYELAKQTIQDPDKIKYESNASSEITIERFFIEYRNEHTSLYYPYFVPADQSGGHYARSRDFADGPIVAVTVRQTNMVATCTTMYFRILKEPTETEHGLYEYIGRDFLFYNSRNALYNQGYPGI